MTDQVSKKTATSPNSRKAIYEIVSKEVIENGEPIWHPEIKRWQCYVCPRLFSRRTDLKNRHMPHHLANKESFLHRCPWTGCDYSDLQKSNVENHINTHTGEKVQCDACPFSCTDPGSLTRHKQKLHGYESRRRKRILPEEREGYGDALGSEGSTKRRRFASTPAEGSDSDGELPVTPPQSPGPRRQFLHPNSSVGTFLSIPRSPSSRATTPDLSAGELSDVEARSTISASPTTSVATSPAPSAAPSLRPIPPSQHPSSLFKNSPNSTRRGRSAQPTTRTHRQSEKIRAMTSTPEPEKVVLPPISTLIELADARRLLDSPPSDHTARERRCVCGAACRSHSTSRSPSTYPRQLDLVGTGFGGSSSGSSSSGTRALELIAFGSATIDQSFILPPLQRSPRPYRHD